MRVGRRYILLQGESTLIYRMHCHDPGSFSILFEAVLTELFIGKDMKVLQSYFSMPQD
jgi:hypothetical protein